MMQQRWWRRVASLSCGKKLISQGVTRSPTPASVRVHVCVCCCQWCVWVFLFVAPASKCEDVCVVRPPQLNIDVLIRRLCCLKPFAPRGVLLTHTSTVTQPYTHAHTEAHADRARLLTSVSSFFSYVNNYWQAPLFLVILCHCLIGQWQSGRDKAHLPHVYSSGC